MRFKGFEGEYKKYSFEDIFLFSTGKNIKQTEASSEFEIPCVRYGELYHLYNEVITEVISKTNLKKSELVFSEGNEILLPSAGEDPLDIGSASALTVKDIAIGRTINILKPIKDGVYSHIYASYYINQKLRKKISTLAKGVSISNVYNSDLKTLDLILPSLSEQKKISCILSLIDKRIISQSKIIRDLETSKANFLENIYSCKVRFKDATGADFPNWERRRLDTFISKFIVPMRDKPKIFDGEIPWCRIEDFDGRYLSSSKSGQGVTKQIVDAMNLKIFPINTLLVSCSANLGFCAITKQELITNQTFIGLVPNELEVNIEFLYYVMKLSAKRLNILSSGTTISYLSREQFEKFEIKLPSLQEQNKIANFLTSLDDKISVEQLLLEKLNQQKQFFLSNLFI